MVGKRKGHKSEKCWFVIHSWPRATRKLNHELVVLGSHSGEWGGGEPLPSLVVPLLCHHHHATSAISCSGTAGLAPTREARSLSLMMAVVEKEVEEEVRGPVREAKGAAGSARWKKVQCFISFCQNRMHKPHHEAAQFVDIFFPGSKFGFCLSLVGKMENFLLLLKSQRDASGLSPALYWGQPPGSLPVLPRNPRDWT